MNTDSNDNNNSNNDKNNRGLTVFCLLRPSLARPKSAPKDAKKAKVALSTNHFTRWDDFDVDAALAEASDEDSESQSISMNQEQIQAQKDLAKQSSTPSLPSTGKDHKRGLHCIRERGLICYRRAQNSSHQIFLPWFFPFWLMGDMKVSDACIDFIYQVWTERLITVSSNFHQTIMFFHVSYTCIFLVGDRIGDEKPDFTSNGTHKKEPKFESSWLKHVPVKSFDAKKTETDTASKQKTGFSFGRQKTKQQDNLLPSKKVKFHFFRFCKSPRRSMSGAVI